MTVKTKTCWMLAAWSVLTLHSSQVYPADRVGAYVQQTLDDPRYASQAPIIRAGRAPLGKALLKLVPPPYHIMLDSSVPTDLVIAWGNGDDWQEVLQSALGPASLVASPNWSTNSVTVTWDPTKPAAQGKRNMRPAGDAAAQPRSSYSGQPQTDYSPQAVENRRFAVEDAKRMSGGFEVSQEDTANPRHIVFEPSKSREDGQARLLIDGDEVVSYKSAPMTIEKYGFPKREQVWELMKAAVLGGKIQITGFSSSPSEKERIRWANVRARTLKEKLVSIGFPENTLVIVERTQYKTTGDLSKVEIVITRSAEQ